MEHLIVARYDALQALLSVFFENACLRNTMPSPSLYAGISGADNPDLVQLACRIYKRGFVDTLQPPTAAFSYQVLDEHSGPLPWQKAPKTAAFVLDKTVYELYPTLRQSLCEHPVFLYEASESNKTLDIVKEIVGWLPSRTCELWAVGGGITLDVVGFAAGLASVPWVAVPTTLLAAVDACCGGKTGVNFAPYGKNQLGLFYSPHTLYFWPTFLKTLSVENLVCGVAEAAKHAYLFGEFPLWYNLFQNILANTADLRDVAALVSANIQYKSAVVALDPLETSGERLSLNFGHTLAHVLEMLSVEGYFKTPLPHGVAVAHGLWFLHQQGLVAGPTLFGQFLEHLVKIYPLKVKFPVPQEVIVRYLQQDKKQTEQGVCVLSTPPYGMFHKTSEGSGTLKQTSASTTGVPLGWLARQMGSYIEYQNAIF